MHPSSRPLRVALLALTLAALAGCSSSIPGPTAPMAPSGMESSSIAKWGPEMEKVKSDTTRVPGLPITVTTGPPILVTDSVLTVRNPVFRDRETTIEVGCIRLRVPAGAIAGDAEIEIKARPNGRGVELHIYPESMNHFQVPLELQTDLSSVSPAVREEMGWFWIDETTGDRVLLEESVVDPQTGRLSAPLHHFSKYEVANRNLGKAGW